MGRLELYRARYRKWRAATGTPDWHRAMAVIRAYNGEDMAANIHRFTAAVQEAIRHLCNVVANLVEDMHQAVEQFNKIENARSRGEM